MKKYNEIDAEVCAVLAELVDRLELEFRYSKDVERLIKQSKRILRSRYFPLKASIIDDEQALAWKIKKL